MKKTKKALASFAIAGVSLSMVPFNAFAADTTAVSTRLAGTTAVQTAQAISKDYLTTSQYAVVAPANPYNMVDALAAAPLAAALKAPVLLTDGDQLSPEVKTEITRLGVKTVYVTSGLAVIKAGVIADLQGLGVTVTSLGGYDQFETSVNIAKVIANVNPTSELFIANGETARVAQDALSVSSIAGADKAPILLTQKGQLPKVVSDYIDTIKAKVTASYITGGTGVVSDDVKAALPGTVTRNSGFDAYDTNLAVLKAFPNLKYDRVFVANGETMVDALAGAPLAAQTNSPIVLVNKTVKSATTDYLQTKVSAKTVVTALGGEAVVPETLRQQVANPSKLNVTTVAGTSDNIYRDKGDQVLKISVNGTDMKVADLVAAGYKVKFSATASVFVGDEDQSDDGIIANSDFSNITDDGFYYTVDVLKGDTVVASSDSKHVSIKDKDQVSSAIDDIKVFLPNKGDDTHTDLTDAVEVKSAKITTDDHAVIQVRGTDADDKWGFVTGDMTYSSSDPSIAYVDKTTMDNYSGDTNQYAEIVTGGNTGAVTLTVKSTDGTTKTLSLTVSDQKRKPSASNTTIDTTSVKLDRGAVQEVGITLKDQYGDPIKDEALKANNPADGDGDLASVSIEGYDATARQGDGNTADGADNDSVKSDKKGRIIVKVDADDPTGANNTGSGTIKVKDEDSDTVKTISFNGYANNSESKYQFDLTPFSKAALDASDSTDKTSFVELYAYDSNGARIGEPVSLDSINMLGDGSNADNTYTLKVDGDNDKNDYVYLDTDGNRLEITSGKKTKTSSVKVAIYESGIQRASINITPDDKRVNLTGVTFESSRPSIGSSDHYDLNDFIRTSDIKTNDGSSVFFEANDDNSLIFVEDIEGTIIGELKAAVTEGDMTVEFGKDDSAANNYIAVNPTADHVDGKVVLTLNKLNGGVDKDATTNSFDSTRADGTVDIPATSTYVGSITINVNDVRQ